MSTVRVQAEQWRTRAEELEAAASDYGERVARLRTNADAYERASDLQESCGSYLWSIQGDHKWNSSLEARPQWLAEKKTYLVRLPEKKKVRPYRERSEVPFNRWAQYDNSNGVSFSGPVTFSWKSGKTVKLWIGPYNVALINAAEHAHWLDSAGRLTTEPLGVVEEDA